MAKADNNPDGGTDAADKTKKLAVGAAVGAAAGFVAGILLAPKSGRETRDDLKKGAKKAAKTANKQLKHTHDELTKIVDKAEDRIGKLGADAKKEATDALQSAKKARDQVAAVMAALKSGNSTDEDLDIAVKNAKHSLDSLKRYFKN